mgnify:CR=1 FL=1
MLRIDALGGALFRLRTHAKHMTNRIGQFGTVHCVEMKIPDAVIDKIEKGCLVCYNDGKMRLEAKKEKWAAGGTYEGSMVAMYRPISRS